MKFLKAKLFTFYLTKISPGTLTPFSSLGQGRMEYDEMLLLKKMCIELLFLFRNSLFL